MWKVIEVNKKNKKKTFDLDEFGKLSHLYSRLSGLGIPHAPAIAIPNASLKGPIEGEVVAILAMVKEWKIDQMKQMGSEEPFALACVITSSMKVAEEIAISGIALSLPNIEVITKRYDVNPLKGWLIELLSKVLLLTFNENVSAVDFNLPASEIMQKVDAHPEIAESDKEFLKQLQASSTTAELVDTLKTFDSGEHGIASDFFKDTESQLRLTLKACKKWVEEKDEVASVLLRVLARGDWGEQPRYGTFYTNDVHTGEEGLVGHYVEGSAHLTKENAKPLANLSANEMEFLEDVAKKVRKEFRSIREVHFIMNGPSMWINDVRQIENLSSQADLNFKLKRISSGDLSEQEMIKELSHKTMSDLLHSILDEGEADKHEAIPGGIHGSYGSAYGKVFFSADALLEAREIALTNSEPTDFILAMSATYSHEVKAIRVANGVISSEGGFSSHAPVVARSMNKVALVNHEIQFGDKQMTVGGKTIKEGEEITINVALGSTPTIYLGYVPLLKPDFETNHLYELLELLEKYTSDIKVYANAEQSEDAKMASRFRADGIGLCRTEHMFFQEDRLFHFVKMLITSDKQENGASLEKIGELQQADFEKLFRVFEEKPVTVRLLDAPLHEFLPKNDRELSVFLSHLQEEKIEITEVELKHKIEVFKEQNPMLGHRGCRMGITSPEIYQMQVRAFVRAATILHKEGVKVQPKIMVPVVMMTEEMSFLRNGKLIEGEYIKGIADVIDEVLEHEGLLNILHVAIGCMIEVPSAALSSEELAQHCEFFSYGTNDLTQTTMGLSRDDSTMFLGDYSKFNVLVENPFFELQPAVKEMILLSAVRGRMRRPDIKLSLCGEHGGNPANVEFFVKNKFDSVSCGPYSIPMIKLALAQHAISTENS